MKSPGKLLERRLRTASVRNAAPPVPLTSKYQTGFSSIHGLVGGANDPSRQMDLWRQVSPLNAGVSLLAQSFSMVHWWMYRTHDNRGRISGPPNTARPVMNHQALNLWNQPNEIMTGQFFRETLQLHLDLTGHSFWVVSKMGSIPTEMWPISKADMDVVPSSNPNYAVAGYIYTGPDGQQIPLQRDEVIWVRNPDPGSLFGGATPLQSMAVELESQRLTAQYKRNFFRNNAEPGGVWDLDLPEGTILSDEEFNTIAERWSEQHRGVNNAHRVAIVERGRWTPTSNSLKDMQFVELRRDDRDAVYEGLGVSKSLLGVTEDVNRSNAETNEYVFAKYRVVPRCERIKDALNGPYLKMFKTPVVDTSFGVYFDYDTPIPDDWRAEAQAYKEKAVAVYNLCRAGATLESAAETVGFTDLEAASQALVDGATEDDPNSEGEGMSE